MDPSQALTGFSTEIKDQVDFFLIQYGNRLPVSQDVVREVLDAVLAAAKNASDRYQKSIERINTNYGNRPNLASLAQRARQSEDTALRLELDGYRSQILAYLKRLRAGLF